MGTTFSNALAGLNANSKAIDVVSANLANLNTYGYKQTTTSFEDLVSENLSAGGGNLASVGGAAIPLTARQFTQGSVTTTNGPFDAAIQGNGFFVLRTTAGQQVYSRAGNFKLDATGHVLTQSGAYVQGWNAINGALNTNGTVSDIVLPVSGLRQPATTTTFSLSANLSANASVGGTDGTFSSPIQVVDSLGHTHPLTVTYTKSAAGQWDYTVTIPAKDVGGAAGSADTTVASGTLAFDPNGHLISPASGATGTVPIQIVGLGDGAADLNINWNLYDSSGAATITQYDQASANLASSQDGVQAGQLTGLGIGQKGQLFATYTNGDSLAVAQLAVASVLNPGSMQDLGNNTFGTTSQTAVPAIGTPGTGSRGGITGGGLESSTVDIAQEFTHLLTYERGYQANSKVITTEDEIIQSTLSLKQ